MSKSRLSVAPTFRSSDLISSVYNLPLPIMINSRTITPFFLYQPIGADPESGLWRQRGYGETLTLQAGSFHKESAPFLGTNDIGIKGDGTLYFQADGNTYGNIGTEDIVIELIFTMGSASKVIFANRNALDPESETYGWGYAVGIDSSSRLYLEVVDSAGVDGSGATVVSAALTANQVYIAHIFADRSGSAQVYLNGIASGSPVVISSETASLSQTDEIFTLMADSISGGTPFDGYVFHVATYIADNWLNTHLQETFAKNRTNTLYAVHPVYSRGGTLPANSVGAYGDYSLKVENNWSKKYWKETGSIAEQKLDIYGKVFTGILLEESSTNLCIYSQDFSQAATWSPARATVPTTAVVCPDGITRTVCTLHEDDTPGDSHYIAQGIGTADTFTYSVFAKAVNRDWIRLAMADGAKYAYFDLANGTVGTLSASTTANMENWGNGWWRIWMRAAHGAWEGVYIYVAEADNDYGFDGLDQDSIYIFGAQIETATYPTSYIPTVGTSATRGSRSLQYDLSISNDINSQEGTWRFTFLAPVFTPGRSHYLMSLWEGETDYNYVSCYIDTNGYVNVVSAAAGGDSGSAQKATNYCDGLPHEVVVTYRHNYLTLYVDGEQGAIDTTVDLHTGAFYLRHLYIGDDYDATGAAGPVLIGPFELYKYCQPSYRKRNYKITV